MVRITEYLRRRCLALRVEDRADLAGMLLQSLENVPRLDQAATLAEIRDIITEEYGVDILETRSRQEPIPYLRMSAMFLARQLLPITQSEVARWMGVKPCTANYYEKTLKEALETPACNPGLIAIYKTISQRYGKNNS